MNQLRCIIICFIFTFVNGCGVVELAGDTVVLAGKVVTTTVKTTASVIKTTGQVAGAGIRYFSGSKTVDLEKIGNSYFLEATINGKYQAKLLLDTGASSVLISPQLAETIGLKLSSHKGMSATLADGSMVPSQSTVLDTITVGSASAKMIAANVIQTSQTRNYDGLLGMSFLQNFIFTIDAEKELLILKYKQ